MLSRFSVAVDLKWCSDILLSVGSGMGLYLSIELGRHFRRGVLVRLIGLLKDRTT